MPLKDQMATGKLQEKVAGRELGEFVISKVEEVIFNKCFLTGMPGGKQQPPCRHDDLGPRQAASYSDAHERNTSILQGAPSCFLPRLTSPHLLQFGVSLGITQIEKSSQCSGHTDAWRSRVFLLFLIFRKQ